MTESAIITAFFIDKSLPKPSVIAKRAGISRSTFFRHHKTAYDTIMDYEKIIYDEYVKETRRLLEDESVKIKDIYLKTLIFINKRQREIKLILKYRNDRIFEKMIWRLKDKIYKDCFLTKNSEQIFKIYTKEIAGVLEEWNKQDFNKNEIEEVLRKITYLTDTAKTRLEPVLEKD